jgi:hypothetical protein
MYFLYQFDKISDNILKLLNSDKYEEMAQAVSLLIESFSDTFSLDEQFELLEYFPKIIAVLGSKPNKKDLKEIYYQVKYQVRVSFLISIVLFCSLRSSILKLILMVISLTPTN